VTRYNAFADMKGMHHLKIFSFAFFVAAIASTKVIAQTVTITLPVANDTTIITNGTVLFEATRSGDFPGSGFIYTFTWSASPSTGVSFTPISTSGLTSTATTIASFTEPGVYLITCAVQRGNGPATNSGAKKVIVFTPNLYSAVNINAVRAWNINPVTGVVLDGPVPLFTPLANTAALAKNRSTTNDPNGCLYYLENTNFSNTGNVNLYAVNPDGTGNTFITTTDINGASTLGLGFVRLGFDAEGTGWILAGDFTTLYLARFTGNGTSATTITTVGTVDIAGSGSANEFQNGDLAISGTGAMFVVANVTGGDTYVYTMSSLTGPTYTLSRRWRLVEPGGNNFTVSVNGVAFTQSGSLHVSSFQGLYFIDQTTANSNTGTVECVPVYTLEGLTDLASDQFPLQSTLPVKLISFSGSLRNNITTLNWEVENEINFSHYEIERKQQSSNNFVSIGSRSSVNSNSRISYNYPDNIGLFNDKVFFYRLKMVDVDGKFKYSNTIMIRKEAEIFDHIHISPNPATDMANVTIRFHSPATGKATLRIVDMSGKTIHQQQNSVTQGLNSISLNGQTALAPGTYMIQLMNEGGFSAAKFLLSH
jgi:hypothetical protein